MRKAKIAWSEKEEDLAPQSTRSADSLVRECRVVDSRGHGCPRSEAPPMVRRHSWIFVVALRLGETGVAAGAWPAQICRNGQRPRAHDVPVCAPPPDPRPSTGRNNFRCGSTGASQFLSGQLEG